MVALFLVFQLFDTLSTWFWVCHHGLAVESNPFMAYLIDLSPGLFILFKLGVAFGTCTLLYLNRKESLATLALRIGLVIYGILACWHVWVGFNLFDWL